MKLEIQYLSGDTEVRPLDPEQSISIGRAGSCEVQVDEEGVAPLHCRLSWNGSAWQLKAANLDGVEVNGQLVRETDLVGDDVIRVGSIDIRFVAESSASDSGDSSEGFIPLATSADDISLKPLDAGEAPAGYVGAGAVEEEEEGEEIRLPAEVRRERAAAESPSRPKSKSESSGKRKRPRRESGSAEASEASEHPINQIFDDDDDFGDDTGGLSDSDDEEEAVPMPGQKESSRSGPEEEE
ncbi:MAG: FHA domain-containing protein, partial [Planctomycetaceae bacterium]